LRRRREVWVAVVALLIGAFAGNLLGEALEKWIPLLARYGDLSLEPRSFRLLNLLHFTLGFSLRINLVGALGALGGLFLARRI
jgi:hypothetical protein